MPPPLHRKKRLYLKVENRCRRVPTGSTVSAGARIAAADPFLLENGRQREIPARAHQDVALL